MRWVFAAALTLAPLPAAADVTARYDLGKEQLVVEVDAGGDYRAEILGKMMLLRRGGTDYVVIFQGSTPLVIERKAFLALAKKMVPAAPAGAERSDVVVAKAGEETVAGRRGTLWTIRVDPAKGNAIQAVMSMDRDLAPVGTVFASVVDAGLEAFGAMIPASNFAERIREVMAKGTPLRLVLMEQVQLRSVSTAEVAATRFALPGPVMDAAAFDQAMSRGPGASTTVPAPETPPAP